MNADIKQRIDRAKELLKTVRHASMATVNADGSPHNTPYFFVCSQDVAKLYWRSRTETQHSQNIARTGQLFVVLYDAFALGGGLYIQAERGRIAEEDELDDAILAFNAAYKRAGRPAFGHAQFAASPPKLYVADITAMWVNDSESDRKGMVTRDYRIKITAADLLQ